MRRLYQRRIMLVICGALFVASISAAFAALAAPPSALATNPTAAAFKHAATPTAIPPTDTPRARATSVPQATATPIATATDIPPTDTPVVTATTTATPGATATPTTTTTLPISTISSIHAEADSVNSFTCTWNGQKIIVIVSDPTQYKGVSGFTNLHVGQQVAVTGTYVNATLFYAQLVTVK